MKRLIVGIAIIAVLVVAVLSISYYVSNEPKTAQIEFAGVILTVELATTPAEQQQGLSDRSSMPEDHGMLFIFNQQTEWSFWMHDMEFPLDIIWFNASRQMVFIEPDLPPCPPSSCPVYTPPVNAMYVLEVNAGFAAANHVELGETFSFV